MAEPTTCNEAIDKARVWKAEFNKRAFIGMGQSAGKAYDEWKYYSTLAKTLKTEPNDIKDGETNDR